MDNTAFLILIIVVLLLLFGGGWYGRGRWYFGFAYIGCMLWRNSRGRPLNAPAWSTVGLIVAVLIIIVLALNGADKFCCRVSSGP